MWWKNKANTQTRDDVVVQGQRATAGRVNYFAVGPVCFNAAQIDRLKNLVNEKSLAAGVSQYGEESVNRDTRRTQGRSLERNDAHQWVYDIVTQVFTQANETMNYDIVPSMNDPIQLLRYDADDQSFFSWHTDTFADDMTRKMSVVVPLNDPSEYVGGALQFIQGGALAEVLQVPGTPVVFPSWLTHQITPVTSGKRYSLVAWIRGPNWR